MLMRVLILAVTLLASCQSLALSNAPGATEAPETAPTEDIWMETEMNGVRLGVWMPSGWDTARSAELGGGPEGLMLAEYRPAGDSSDLEVGVLVYLFAPPLDHFYIPEDSSENAALSVLDQVVQMPSQIGFDAIASRPVEFEWDGHDAAYYLLSSSNSIKTIVLAVETQIDHRLVICNINMPASEAERVRRMLPEILDGLMIDDQPMNGDGLAVLPDPLVFPEHHHHPDVTATVIQ